MDLGQRIKLLREKQKMNQNELAICLKISNSALSQYETGARTPSDDVKIAIADFFGVSVDYLLRGVEQKEKPAPAGLDGQSPIDEKRLDEQLVQRLCSLTPEEQGKVDAFIQGLLSSRQKPGGVIHPAGK